MFFIDGKPRYLQVFEEQLVILGTEGRVSEEHGCLQYDKLLFPRTDEELQAS